MTAFDDFLNDAYAAVVDGDEPKGLKDFSDENAARVGLPLLFKGEAVENSVVLLWDDLTGFRAYASNKLLAVNWRLGFFDLFPLPQKCLRHFMTLILSEVKDD